MTSADPYLYQPNHFSSDAFPRPTPIQPHHYALQNAGVLPAAANGQLEDHWEDIPHPVGGVAELARHQDLHHVDMANRDIVDHHPLPLDGRPIPYEFPDVRPQGIQARGLPNAPGNQEYDHLGYAPEYVVPEPVLAPGQSGAENIRRIASHYLHHPNSQVDVVRMEPGTADRFKVVIVLEVTDIL